MYPRRQIIEMFSTFARLEGDRFQQWITDPRLRRSIQRCSPHLSDLQSDKAWSLYWYQQWSEQRQNVSQSAGQNINQSASHLLAESHLSAYLQESCYWVAQQISQRFQTNQYTLTDCFQLASSEVRRVLKRYVPDRGSSLKSFAAIVLTSALKDMLRQRQVADICSDWSLLRRISKKRIGEVLEQAGLVESDILQYRWAWLCFQTVYVPTQLRGSEQLPKPDLSFWHSIAHLYNSKRQAQLATPGPALTPEQIEIRLTKLARWIRTYLYPAIDSLNKTKTGQDGEFQDDLTADLAPSLLDAAIQQEEIEQRHAQRSRLQSVLNQSLEHLEADLQEILRLFYQQGLSQQELAADLKTSQPTVSRRLKKAEECLLAALIHWVQADLNQFPNPDELKTINMT
ncbi:MAG: sigma-70 family RNA polymerase sigma factor [Leptolyngbyaceae cyanobacterium CSU_1_3]|nr:sigma-70 family RNA polymerase sigma factor [Leptolyngbyaceae cyanobacterium CSU_1_3]